MKRYVEIYWPFVGMLLAIPYYLGFFKIPSMNLELISILFGGLLALLLILPTIENFRQIKKLKETGHINDLIYYIRFPLTLAILFILIEFFSQSLTISFSAETIVVLESLYFGLWSIFFLALFRLVGIIPHLLYNN